LIILFDIRFARFHERLWITVLVHNLRISWAASTVFWILTDVRRARQAGTKKTILKIWLGSFRAILKDFCLLIFVILLYALNVQQLSGLRRRGLVVVMII